MDNFSLENENKFDENFVYLLNHFLLQLPQPVCLVAHNGDKFDFPIIQRQLKTLNMNLPDGLLCMDSLLFFRFYEGCDCALKKTLAQCPNRFTNLDYLEREKLDEPKPLADEITINKEFKEPEDEVNRPSTTEQEPCVHVTTSNAVQLENEIVEPCTSSELTSDFVDINEALTGADMKEKQKCNESTPSNRKTAVKKELFSKRILSYGSNSVTPPSKRQLFTPTNGNFIISPSKRMKFTLSAVHERLFGIEPNKSHYAENDVLALMKCAVASKMEFIKYAEENAKFFKDIKPIGM